MNPIHLKFSKTSPFWLGLTAGRVFNLLDILSPEEKEMLLYPAYIFGMSEAEWPDTAKAEYSTFKNVVTASCAECLDAGPRLFGMLSVVLSYLAAKGDLNANAIEIRRCESLAKNLETQHESFRRLHKDDQELHRFLDGPEGDFLPDSIVLIKDRLLQLYAECVRYRRIYDRFCEQVIGPLLSDAEGLATSNAPDMG